MKFENGYGESTIIVYFPLFGEQTSNFFSSFIRVPLTGKKRRNFKKFLDFELIWGGGGEGRKRDGC